MVRLAEVLLAPCALAGLTLASPAWSQVASPDVSVPLQHVLIQADTQLEGDLTVASLRIAEDVTVLVTHDLSVRSDGPIVIEGHIVGVDADARVDGIDHGGDIRLESRHSIRVEGSVRAGDGRDGLLRHDVSGVLRALGLEPLIYGAVEIHDDMIHLAIREAWQRGELDEHLLAGARGGDVAFQAPVSVVDGPVVGGAGGQGGPHGSGGRGGDVSVCGAAFTGEEARVAGAAIYGGRGGPGGQMLHLPRRGQTGGDGGDAVVKSGCEGQTPGQVSGPVGTDAGSCGEGGGGGTSAIGGDGGPGPTGDPGTPTSPIGGVGCTGGKGGKGVGGKGGTPMQGCDNCPDGPGGTGGRGGNGGDGTGGKGGQGGKGGDGFSFPSGLCYKGGPGGVGGNGGFGKGGSATDGAKGGRPYGEGGDKAALGAGDGHAGAFGVGGEGGEPGAGVDVVGSPCTKGATGVNGAAGTGSPGRGGRVGVDGDPCPQIGG